MKRYEVCATVGINVGANIGTVGDDNETDDDTAVCTEDDTDASISIRNAVGSVVDD